MFAIAWKEYRQMRLTGVFLVGVLVLVYVAAWASPWAEYRGGVIFIGPFVVVSLLGALAFAQERHERTDRFLTALPLGNLRRWAGKAIPNLAFACGAVALLFLAIWLIDEESRSKLFNEMPLSYLPWSLIGLGVLLFLWAISVFYSALFERPITALVWTWATLITGAAFALRLRGGIDVVDGGEVLRLKSVVAALLATPTVVFLSGSVILEGTRSAVISRGKKALAVVAVAGASLCAMVLIMTAGVTYAWEATNRKIAQVGRNYISSISALPTGDALLVLRGDRRVIQTDLAGAWRAYEAGNVEIPWWRMTLWPVSPDGDVLAYFERRRKSFAETLERVVRWAWTAKGGMFDNAKYLPRFLDLGTGKVVAPKLPQGSNVLSTFLGWHGDPPRLFVLVDRYERGVDGFYYESNEDLLESEVYVLSKEGDLIEKRDVSEMTESRKTTRLPRPEGGSQWCPVGVPLAAGDYVVVPYTWAYHAPLDRRSRYEGRLRPTMSYNLLTGRYRERVTADPKRHLAFSPDLEWEILVERPVPLEWEVHDYYRYETSRGSVSFSADLRGDAGSEPLPGLVLEGAEGRTIGVCSFSPGLRDASVGYAFLSNGKVFFALVVESAAEPTPGFEEVVHKWPGGKPFQMFDNRRVRAVAVDLESGGTREEILSPGIVDFLVSREEPEVICHSSMSDQSRLPKVWFNWECLILSLPELGVKGTYTWPEGDGPVFNMRGWGTAFVGSERVASVTSIMQLDVSGKTYKSQSVVSVWRIGPEPPVIVRLPGDSGEQ